MRRSNIPLEITIHVGYPTEAPEFVVRKPVKNGNLEETVSEIVEVLKRDMAPRLDNDA